MHETSSQTTAKSLISTGHLKQQDAQLFCTLTDKRAKRFRDVLLRRTRQVTIVLDGVRGPHNVGAVARTCDAWGIQDLHFISEPSADSDMSITSSFDTDKTVRKVSKNSHRWLSMKEYTSPREAIAELRSRGYQICVSSLPLRNSNVHVHDIFDDNDTAQLCNGKLAFVFGAEQDGVSQDSIDEADAFFTIPMVGFTESFNVSVAVSTLAAVVLPRMRNKQWAHRYGGQKSDCYLGPNEAAELASSWLRGVPTHVVTQADPNAKRRGNGPLLSNGADHQARLVNTETNEQAQSKSKPISSTSALESVFLMSTRRRRLLKPDSGTDAKSLGNRYAKGDVTRLGTGVEGRILERGLFVRADDIDGNDDETGKVNDDNSNHHQMIAMIREFGIRLHPKTGALLIAYFNKRKFGAMGDYKWKNRRDNMTYFISGSNALTCATVTKQVYNRRVDLLPLFKAICQDVHGQFSTLFDRFGTPLHPSSPGNDGSHLGDLTNAEAIQNTGAIVTSHLTTFGIDKDEVQSMTFADVCEAFATTICVGGEDVKELTQWSAQCMYDLHSDVTEVGTSDEQIVDEMLSRLSETDYTEMNLYDEHQARRRANVNVTIRAAHAAWVCAQIHLAVWDKHRSVNGNRLRAMRCNLLENVAVDAYARFVMDCSDGSGNKERRQRLGVAKALLEWYRPLWMLRVNCYSLFD